ncbi:MAG: Ig-like domain-containing protein, partial [Planctomycetota bacterium]
GQGQNGYEEYPVVARYLTDGRLDTTFGNQGVWTSEDLPGPVQDLAIQADGRLLLALGFSGYGNDQQALAARLTASGQLDSGFGDGGIVRFDDTGSFDAIAVTEHGRVLAAGHLRSLNDKALLIVAYTATGVRDTGFDGDGVWTQDLSTASSSASGQIKDLLIHDGKLWLAGSRSAGYSDLLLMRTDLQGRKDSDFGQDGMVVANLSKDDRGDELIRLAALPDGRVIGIGSSANENWQGWMIAALFNESGLDTSFAEDGLQVIDVDPNRQDVAMGVALLSDGFLITGYGDDGKSGTVRSALAARLGFDGSLVASFGGDGKLLFEHPDLRSLSGVVVDGQRAYLAGNNDEDAVLARILLGEVSDEAPPEITEGEQVTVDMDEDGQPTPFALSLNATDADTPASELIWAIGRAAEHGQADVSTNANGGSQVISYLPEADYYGTDSFTVIVSDGYLTDSIEVAVRIQEQPDEPSGSPEIQLTASGRALADGATLAGPTLITGDSAQTLTLRVHNQGDATLSIDPMLLDQISGVTALISRQPPNAVAAGNQADIDISLSASAVGSYSLRCRLNNNDDDEGSYTIRIEGQVVATRPDPRRIRLLLNDEQGPMPIQIELDPSAGILVEDAVSYQWTITGLDSAQRTRILILEPGNG